MHDYTGEIKPLSEIEKLPKEEQNHFIEIKRDLKEHEIFNSQIMMYAPCGCGSGKKFKFCCHKEKK